MGNSCSTKSKHSIYKYTGWWFGTFFIFLWIVIPTDFDFFRGVETANQYIYIIYILYYICIYIIYIYILYIAFSFDNPFWSCINVTPLFQVVLHLWWCNISRIFHSNHMWVCDSLHLPMVFRFGCQPKTLWWRKWSWCWQTDPHEIQRCRQSLGPQVLVQVAMVTPVQQHERCLPPRRLPRNGRNEIGPPCPTLCEQRSLGTSAEFRSTVEIRLWAAHESLCQEEMPWSQLRMLDPSMFGWFNANYRWYHIIGVILIYVDPNQYPCTWNGCFSTPQLGLSVNGLYNQNWWLFSIGKWWFIHGFRATI